MHDEGETSWRGGGNARPQNQIRASCNNLFPFLFTTNIRRDDCHASHNFTRVAVRQLGVDVDEMPRAPTTLTRRQAVPERTKL